ncbi:MAG: DUF1405 domain-containing protein [Candidatus Heimdallarchaeota archaeon]|nr:MAG: DUF1405 domain-containing protein [Candidatus Heimdallarchaeota archaeon]
MRLFFQQLKSLEIKILGFRTFIATMIVGNLLGSIIGFLYYFQIIGLFNYPPILWILIPDCPMAVLLLLGVYLQRNNQKFANFNFFVFIQGIRAAAITFFFIAFFESLDFPFVFIGHFLLLLQAIAILPLLVDIELNKGTFFTVGITVINDISDFVGFPEVFHPTLVQLSTIQPVFPWFGLFIFVFDVLLILFGLGFKWFMNSPEVTYSSYSKLRS